MIILIDENSREILINRLCHAVMPFHLSDIHSNTKNTIICLLIAFVCTVGNVRDSVIFTDFVHTECGSHVERYTPILFSQGENLLVTFYGRHTFHTINAITSLRTATL